MSEESMKIRTMRLDQTVVAIVSGELDMLSARYVAALEEMLTDQTVSLILDLTGVTYMDSTGLQSILALHRSAQNRQLPMTVHVRNQSNMHRVMRLVGADSVLSLVAEPMAWESGPNPPSPRR